MADLLSADLVAKNAFLITMVGSAIFVGVVFVGILL